MNSAPAVAPETPNQLATDRATLAQEKEDAVQQQDNEDIGIFSVEIFRKERNFFLSCHYVCELLRQTSVETSYISSSGMKSSAVRVDRVIQERVTYPVDNALQPFSLSFKF